MRGPASIRSRRHRRFGPTGLLVGVLAGMLVACGAPDRPVATPATATSPSSAPTSQESAVAVPSEESPEPSPTRGDIVTPEPGRLPSDVLPTPLPTRPVDPATMGPALESVVTAAVRDLEGRVEGAVGDGVEVMLARPETFRDGSLGCPRPGEVPTQAQVEGHRVLLRHGDRVWLYTAAAGQEPRLCPSDAKDGGFGFVPPPGLDD